MCQSCNAVVKNRPGSKAEGGGQQRIQYNRRPKPTNVSPTGTPCGSCGSYGHKTTECQNPRKYMQTTKDWIKDAKCKACAEIGHVWKNCVDPEC